MQVIVITGGSRGIGAAAARACAARGMGIILTYNSQREAAEAVVAEVEARGVRGVALPLDVSDTASFCAFRVAVADSLREVWNGIALHGLVNNAGFGLYSPLDAVTEAQFDGLFSVHLKGPFFLTQALLPLIGEGGAIVNLTSATTRVATAGVAPYASFKGGLEVLTRYMAKELGPRRVRANAVSPGAIRTDLGGGLTDEFEALLASQTALGRVGEADEVGRVIASLLADDLGWVNGQSLEVGGGYCP
ncbi:SDR family NAD(P)-dependent oxidoreductase [Methylorubrum extorquens]|jgi:NAD(P)-dependent dehydrogenase (short-subunit alcohol dehydrogenase family)|uniref:Short-chain dehydrogenase/reductase n=2 Tax=Methylorubrum extorquens TaxID=408 RepID=C5B696_METEA|nr:SDR family oxidoreductase [Methylorubrum extorquens]ACS43978.1 Short-chain dehydrogenase/reductase [Methylorubrum extorquens AM1]EHP95079.1 3-oxoacyl-(acyl-carrier-protein) reductase [Methylorubrum extorquens DSM 13060]MCP1546161.1 NAD(P)-dependent dehydrogenase (short-subunit alcohol dehydrogenase family) [Methylorubrum extorquens]MCP1590828.1 NAD(P)-dependent dehydrogenase (short-subunit alcohol dehydrogenase family) [Methylorubrum extorquens]